MDIHVKPGTLVRFKSHPNDDFLVKWGSNDDPKGILKSGAIYKVLNTEIHTWHTKVYVTKFPNLKFNYSHVEDLA